MGNVEPILLKTLSLYYEKMDTKSLPFDQYDHNADETTGANFSPKK